MRAAPSSAIPAAETARATAAALAIVAVAVALQLAIGRAPVSISPLFLLITAVVVSTRLAGRLAGIIATLAAAVAWDLLLLPNETASPGVSASHVQPILFLAGSATLAWLLTGGWKSNAADTSAADDGFIPPAARQLEIDLAKTNELLEAIVENTTAAVFVKDRAGRYTLANETCEQLWGLPRSDIIGKTDAEILPPEIARRLRTIDVQTMKSERPQTIEEEIDFGSGPRVFLSVKVPLRSPSGEPAGICGIATDITDRYRAQSVLAEREAHFRMMADTAPVLVWIADANNQGTFFNRGWLEFTGRRLEQELGEGWLESIHPDDRAAAQQHFERAVAERSPFEMQFRLLRHDGTYRWVLDRGVPRFDTGGGFEGYIGTCSDITEQITTEEALRRSEQRLRFTLQSLRVATWTWDPRSDHVSFSDNLSEIYRAETLRLGEGLDVLLTHVPPEDRERFREAVQRVGSQGGTFTLEYRTCPPGGGVRWLEAKGTALRETLPSPVTGVCTDVTSRKEIELVRERLAAIVAGSRDAIIGMSLEGTITDWNEGAEQIYGYPPSEAIGQPVSLVVPPDQEGEGVSILARLRRGEQIDYLETTVARKDGQERQVALTISPIESSGRILGVAIIGRDFSERRRFLEALRIREERFRIALSSSPIFVFNQDERLRYTWSHDPGERFSPEQLLGKTDREICEDPEDAAKLESIKSCVLETGVGVREEVSVRLDGETRHWDVTVEPLLSADGRVQGLTGAFFDITDRTRLENELRRQARQLADNDRRKDEFLAMLAHELRNPLAPISYAVEILRRDPSSQDEATATTLDLIARQARHVTKLVDDLLDVARITRGTIQLAREILDVADVVANACEACQPALEESGHELIVARGDPGLHVRGDPTRLTQVLTNLLDNAIKFSRPGGRIWLSVTRGREHVRLSVRDEGIGIAPEMRERIFDLFTQGETSLARSRGGLGLGLTLAKRLVEQHDGTLEARSSGRDHGSEFLIRLPTVTVEPEKPKETTMSSEPRVDSRRILVVDDNADATRGLAILLRSVGHEVRTALDGAQALEVAREFHPQIIFLDLGLPIVDGYQVAEQIRGEDFGEEVSLIALTGYGREQDIERSLSVGFDRHLVKPIEFDKVHELVNDLTARHS